MSCEVWVVSVGWVPIGKVGLRGGVDGAMVGGLAVGELLALKWAGYVEVLVELSIHDVHQSMRYVIDVG